MKPEPHKRRHQEFRDLPSHVFGKRRLTKSFRRFMDDEICPLLKFKGYRLDEKRELACQMVNQLIKTRMRNEVMADSRDTHQPGVRIRVAVWNAIVAAGLAEIGLGSEASGKVTRYRATLKLWTMQEEWKLRMLVRLDLVRNSEKRKPSRHGLVLIYRGKVDAGTGELLNPINRRKLLPVNSESPQVQSVIRAEEGLVESFNQMVLLHTWKWYETDPESGKEHVRALNPCVRKIYSGGWPRSGRFYSWDVLSGQELSKARRKTILIDEQPVSEFDISGTFIRMAYHIKGVDPDRDEDLYRPHVIFPKFYSYRNVSAKHRGIVRDFVKRCTNICLHVRSHSQANSSVGRELAEHPHREFLWNEVCGADDATPKRIVRRIVKAHPHLKKRDRLPVPKPVNFFNDVGPWLMTYEGWVMQDTIIALTLSRIPALTIHDGLVVRKSDGETVKQLLVDAYSDWIGFEPVVKQAF